MSGDHDSGLPRSWVFAPFSVVADIASNLVDPKIHGHLPHIAPDNIERETGRLLSFNSIAEDGVTSPKHLFYPGQVLYSKIRPYLNKCVLVDFSGLCSADMYPLQSKINPAYLHNYILSRTFVSAVDRAAGSRTILPKTNQAQLAHVPVPVAPDGEQQRVVEALDSYLTRLDAVTTSLKRVEANLKRYRASVLKAAVEGHLVPTEAELARKEGRDYEPASTLLARILKERRVRWEQTELARLKAKGTPPKDNNWKSKYQPPAEPNTEGLPNLPEGWCWATLPQLGELGRGKSKHRPRDDERLFGGPYPFVQTGEVRACDTFINSFSATYSDFGLKQSRLWPKGTLCITIAANIAETSILGFDACFPDSVVGFLTDSVTLTRFAEYFIRTAREHLENYAPATAQKNINLETLSALAIPVPPISEQERIISLLDARMSQSCHCASSARESLTRVVRLRHSILKWAFEGKLVDQDPNDEPASALLERIRNHGKGTVRTNSKRTPRNEADSDGGK